jgi:hypothetical protein
VFIRLCASKSSCLRFAAERSLRLSGRVSGTAKVSSSHSISAIVCSASIPSQYPTCEWQSSNGAASPKTATARFVRGQSIRARPVVSRRIVFLVASPAHGGTASLVNSSLQLMIKRLSVRYSPHPCFPSADGSTKAWRYMDFTKFVSLLDSNALFFSRADRLSDAWEGAHTVENLRQRPTAIGASESETTAEMMNGVSLFHRSLRLHTFVSCWHLNSVESVRCGNCTCRTTKG